MANYVIDEIPDSERDWVMRFKLRFNGETLFTASYVPDEKRPEVERLAVTDIAKAHEAPKIAEAKRQFVERYGISPFRTMLIHLCKRYGSLKDGFGFRLQYPISNNMKDAIKSLGEAGLLEAHGITLHLKPRFVRRAKLLRKPELTTKTTLMRLFKMQKTVNSGNTALRKSRARRHKNVRPRYLPRTARRL